MAKLNLNRGLGTSNSEVVQLAELGNGIVQITMKDEKNRNSFSRKFIDKLFQCFESVSQNPTYQVVILAGTSHYFSTGATQEQLQSIFREEIKFTDFYEILTLALDCPIPVIAAMEGHALGGGLNLGLYADFIVLSRESFYANNLMKYGLTPVGSTSFILPKKLGAELGQEMIYTGRQYRGAELAQRGIPFPVLPRKEVLKYAHKLAKEIAEKPRLSLLALKENLTEEIRSKLPAVVSQELEMHEKTFQQAKLANQEIPKTTSQPVQLKIASYGSLKNLTWVSLGHQSPGVGEVKVQIQAVPVNFRDILNALGMLEGHNQTKLGITSVEYLTFGFEAVGVIVAVGSEVSQWQIGDEVMVIGCHDAFSSFIICSQNKLIAKPSNLKLIEAATIPIPFFTAYHGLHNLAKLQSGERVLIHAASGGTGQAAVQLAQFWGAEVFATTSPQKMAVLQEQGVKHVMNSRTTEFAKELRELTQGQGVDVIFNSLTHGEYIHKNLDVLALGGRYIEIGKKNIWSHAQVAQKRPDIQYFPFDLLEEFETNNLLYSQIEQNLVRYFEYEKLHPLTYQTFPSENIVEAFRYLQQSEHLGRVVVTMSEVSHKELSNYRLPNKKQMDQQEELLNQLQSGQISLENAEELLLKITQEEPPGEAIQEQQVTSALIKEPIVNKSEEILSLLGSGEISIENAESLLLGSQSELEVTKNDNNRTTSDQNTDIAIIGISCRYPGAKNYQEFWVNLKNGVDSVTEPPPGRWEGQNWYHPDPEHPGTSYCKCAGFIDDIDKFDPSFFQISPGEAQFIEPQQRIFLEEAYHAIEDAGYAPDSLKGRQCGVFVGAVKSDYSKLLSDADLGTHRLALSGNQLSIVPARIAYFLDLRGPVMAVETACSASLVAVHQACESIKQGESELAIAGGIHTMLTPDFQILSSQFQMISGAGRCKTFDAEASGTVWSEGCGVLLLKSYEQAVRDQDHIYGVIKGTGINYDGNTNGISAPSSQSQTRLEETVYQKFGINPETISYVEAHGTATSLGDPIEVEALTETFSQWTNRKQFCSIGSVKTNIGHASTAAGVSGLIKTILCLKHQKLVPSLHFNQPNPHIDFANSPFYINTELKDWEVNEGKPRRAAVSSFGFSGTNAHIVIEEALTEGNRQQATGNSEDYSKGNRQQATGNSNDYLERSVHLLTLSAKTETALAELVGSYQNYLKTHPELGLVDICHTANIGRTHFNHRLAVVAENQQELVEKLQQHQLQEEVAGIISGEIDKTAADKIAFLFTGQGSQYVNMGRELYQQSPTFREAINQCEDILSRVETFQEISLREILYPADNSSDSSLLNQTAYTQPCLFAIEYALCQLWQSWGIKPDAVMGHSVGEYVAATVAGVFSLEDALKLIAARGRLMQQLPAGGEMVSVMASESKVLETLKTMSLGDKVAIAAINGPQSIVISGESQAVRAIATNLESAGIKTKQLQVSHAFHSSLMEPMLAEFEAVAKEITYEQPRIPLISNVTGKLVGEEITSAEYWVNHVRQPVRFAQSMTTLHQEGYELFLEIGPKPILLGMGRQCFPEEVGVWLPSLRPGAEVWQQMFSSLGQLYVEGAKVDWRGLEQDYPRQKLALPTYPFQRERYWVETAKSGKTISTTKLHPLINQKFQSPLAQGIFFESHFSTTTLPFLADHLIYDQVVVPGASHISLLLAAASLTFNTTKCQLEDILFPQSLTIPEQGVRNVQVALTPQESSYSFQMISFEDSLDAQTNEVSNNGNQVSSWAVHATGKLAIAKAKQSLVSLEEIQSRCCHKIDNTEIYQYLWDRQIKLGQSFRWIDQVWLGEGEVLCQMKVPQTVLDASKYQLHPALLDSCLQSIIAFNLSVPDDKKETFVPFSVEKFTFYNPPQAGLLWCYTSRSKDQQSAAKFKADVQIFDQDRQLLAQVTGFECRRANPETFLSTLGSDLSNWFYQINWQAQPRPSTSPPQENQTGNWLVFALTSKLAELIGKELHKKGHNCIWVSPGSEYQQLDDQHYQINPTVAEQFPQLLQDNPNIKGIVHLWGVNEATNESLSELEKAQELGCATLLHLVQGLLQVGLTQVVPMWLVTQGTQSVLAETEVVQPQQGSLWGLGRVIRLEHPELTCYQVDLDAKSSVTETIPILANELLFNSQEDQIAIRKGTRYVARLVQQQKQKLSSQQLPISEGQPLKKSIQPEASYLITGGLGALGLEVAQWMVTEGAKHLVLTGRRAPNATAQKVIVELETAGTSVSVLLGDVSAQEDMAKIFQQMRASLPPLKGVIHAAGVLDDGILRNLSWQRFNKVMAPKVQGTWHLHQLTKDLPLDFFVCFSSMASVLGNSGQGSYAAANAFMDAVAHYRGGIGLPGLSINWGAWASAGMAASLDSLNQQRLDAIGMSAIERERGMQALGSLLSDSPSQVGVFPINWSKFVSQLSGGHKIPFLEALISTEPSLTQKSSFLLEFEATVPSERRSSLVDHVRHQAALVLGINNPESISLETGFFNLGMDSLNSVELRKKLQTSLECSLPSTVAFDYPTVTKLVDYLIESVLEQEYFDTVASATIEAPNDEKQEDLLLNKTKELSEEELEKMINQKFNLLINE
ncbi:MAG: SDR family NAD(P)-dependent oxidoreductase [Symploca sp. SIO1B1]|nr:SDR family NAD(P)-dependent oxidoreductase [Symploca sp. SIO1C2]NER93304.1 SDR family NAD(P)-dependent oxidoreductase [Symploca sp. SIO1B1]